jgi:MFS family permease
MNEQERRTLIITCFGHFMSHFNMLAFSALVLPLSARMGLDVARILDLSFWMYLLFGVSALPWGMAADRIGGIPLMRLYFLGAGVCSLGAAFWIDSPAGLALALAGLGLFSGIYHPVGLGMISKGVSQVSLALGYNGMFGNLGLAAAPLLTGLLHWLWGPGAAYSVLAGLNLLGFLVMLLLPIDLSATGAGSGHRSQSDSGMPSAFLILLAAMMLGGLAYRGATVLMPTYFELKNSGIAEAFSSLSAGALSTNLTATLVTSTIYLVGVLGQYTGGRIAQGRDPRIAYLVFHSVCVPAAFLMAVTSDLPLVALSLVYFFFLLGGQPIENTLVARFAPARLHHSAYGTKFILTFGVGALAVPLVGSIQSSRGIEACFPALGSMSLALVAVAYLLARKTKS